MLSYYDKEMSSKRKAGKRPAKYCKIESSPQPSREVEYAEASTQTEDKYTDDDYYSCCLKSEVNSDSMSYEYNTQQRLINKSPGKKASPGQQIHYNVSCSEEQINPQLQKVTSGTQKRVKCNICNKWLSSISSFIQHKSMHTGERPHQCEFCHKTFRQHGNLASHRRTHIGVKPYKCDICDKRFANSSNVVVHKRTHTGEKPFECEICHKRFSQFAHLVGHKRTHTGEAPFQCDICQKRFNNPSNLTTHKRIHGGDRPYQCDICHKTFKQSGHLSSHKKSHVEEQPLAYVKVTETVTQVLAERCSENVKQETKWWTWNLKVY